MPKMNAYTEYMVDLNEPQPNLYNLLRLPTIKERINIPQAQFLFRSFTLPKDTLLTKLMPHIQHGRYQQ